MKFGKTGQFLACTGYPACRYTSNYTRDEQGQIHLQEKVKPEFEKVGTCPECGKDAEVWSRVVGYLRPVQNYNPGKKEEYMLRKKFVI